MQFHQTSCVAHRSTFMNLR